MKMADKTITKDEIEIVSAFTLHNRLSIQAKINGEPMNFNFPAKLGEDKKVLHERIKAEYHTMKANCAKHKATRAESLIGKVTV
jgi:hypothetical protein